MSLFSAPELPLLIVTKPTIENLPAAIIQFIHESRPLVAQKTTRGWWFSPFVCALCNERNEAFITNNFAVMEKKIMNQPDQFEINPSPNHLANRLAGQSGSGENMESLADLPLTDAQADATKAGIIGGSAASSGEIPWQVSLRH